MSSVPVRRSLWNSSWSAAACRRLQGGRKRPHSKAYGRSTVPTLVHGPDLQLGAGEDRAGSDEADSAEVRRSLWNSSWSAAACRRLQGGRKRPHSKAYGRSTVPILVHGPHLQLGAGEDRAGSEADSAEVRRSLWNTSWSAAACRRLQGGRKRPRSKAYGRSTVPIRVHGPHRAMRLAVRKDPTRNPYFRIDSRPYTEHVGVKRHCT